MCNAYVAVPAGFNRVATFETLYLYINFCSNAQSHEIDVVQCTCIGIHLENSPRGGKNTSEDILERTVSSIQFERLQFPSGGHRVLKGGGGECLPPSK